MKQIKLKPEAKQIWEAIPSGKKVSIADIVNLTGLDQGTVASMLIVLEKEKLIEREITESETFELTKRGKKILETGLPEQLIVSHLAKSTATFMKDLSSIASIDRDDLSAGIGTLKKQNLIEINKGQVILKENIRPDDVSGDIMDALQNVSKGLQIASDVGEKLLSRGFVERKIKQQTLIQKREPTKVEIVVQQEVSKLTPQMITSGEWKNVSFKPYNVRSKPRQLFPGKYHPYRHFHDQMREKLIALGFREMKGSLIEQEFWNFDALFAPQDHPAREDSDIFLITDPTHGELPREEFVGNVRQTHENGWITGSKGYGYRWNPLKAARLLLRPQGTAISARTLRKVKPPEKYFSIAKCFRPDDIDATHGCEFYQVEGIVCDPSITFRDLLGVLKIFAEDIAGATEVSFRPDYYPFTSPSVELSARHPTLGRIEFGGAGIFRPEVVRPFGIDYPVIAWGLGVDRLFMVKYQIKDIRELFSQDLSWLRDVEVSSGIEVNN